MALLGLRPAEVAALRREDYRPPRGGDCGRLASRGIKGHADRDIPIVRGGKQQRWLAACLALGKRLGRAQPRQPLVPCQAGKSRRRPGGWTTESFDQTLKRLCGKLKINLLAYWVRHSGISYAQTRSATLASIQQMAGHSKITTQEAYTHRLAKDAMPAYEALGEALEDM
jgi:site-specific recombinase XerD